MTFMEGRKVTTGSGKEGKIREQNGRTGNGKDEGARMEGGTKTKKKKDKHRIKTHDHDSFAKHYNQLISTKL